jgi:hypothetical protein
MGLDVVHGEGGGTGRNRVMIGTDASPGHLLEHKRIAGKLVMLITMKRLILLGILACCSSSPANVGGTYSISGTNETNGCMINGWTMGNTFTGVTVVITQSGSSATAIVMGGGGQLFLDLLLNTHSFLGSVDGDAVKLAATGTNPQTSGNCTYTYDAEIDATLSGDELSGKINYTTATNGNSDCATIKNCVSFQNFNGTRPPM